MTDSLSKDRIGMIGKNRFGTIMKIVSYKNTHKLWVKFEKGGLVQSTWQNFCNGNIKNPYDSSVYGIGFIGEGDYKVSEKCKSTRQYKTWQSMLGRGYDDKYHITHPSYIGCSVSEEWHNFQNFAKWYDENYYEFEGLPTELDKDILVKGNKVYSSENCVFVPHSINKLFLRCEAGRGNLPIGVSLHKRNRTYSSSCGKEGKVTYHNTPDEAFNEYKLQKEKSIKTVAERYREKIPTNLYKAMMNYEVQITD